MAIAKLSIDFEARIAQFEGELKRLSGVADSVTSKLSSSFKSIAMAGAGLAGIGGFAALQSKVMDAVAGMAELKDAAERTGASVENLSALKGVAKIGGRDFEQIEGAIVKLNKALHSTDDESKGAGKALAAIGLDVTKLREMDPAAAVLEIAKALDQFADGGGKSAAAVAIFGKAGAQMIPFLKDLAEKGELVGKVTKEQAEMADQYEKNVAKLNATFGETSKRMAAELLPTLTEFSQQLLDGIKYAGGFWAAIGAGGTINPFKSTAENLKTIRADLAEMERVSKEEGYTDDKAMARKKAQLEMLKAQQRREALAGDPAANMDANDRKFANKPTLDGLITGKENEAAAKKVSDAQSIIRTLNEQIAVKQLDYDTDAKITEGQKILAKAMADIEAGTIKVTATEKAMIAAKAEKLTAIEREVQAKNVAAKADDEEQKRLSKHLNDLDEEVRRTELANEQYGLTAAQISVISEARLEEALAIAKQQENNEGQVAVLERELDARRRISRAMIEMDQKKQAIDEINQQTRSGADAARELGMTFTSAFEEAVVGGKRFSQVLQGLYQDILKIALRKTITEPMAGIFSDLFGGLFGKSSSTSASSLGIGQQEINNSAGIASVFSANGNVFSGPGISAYSGSIVSSPTLFPFANGIGLMGEAGDEAILPLKRINGKLGVRADVGGGGGDVVVNVINNAGGTQARAQQRTDAGGKSIIDVFIEQAKGAIVQDIGSGGAVAGALEKTYGVNRAAGAWR